MDYLELKRNRRGNIVTKPTYLYDALYSQFSIFDGFSIQWVDGEYPVELEEGSEVRINVSEYEKKKRIKWKRYLLLKEKDVQLLTRCINNALESGILK